MNLKNLLSFIKRNKTYVHRRQATIRTGGIDRLLFIAVVFLSLFGVLMVYDSSVAIAIRDFGNQYFFVAEQVKWLGVGLVSLLVFSFIDYRRLYPLAVPLLLITIALLIGVFLPGLGVHALGARRWVNLGFTTLQPAELAKFTLVLYLSAWFATKERERFTSFLLLLGMVVGLIIIEPDLGTSIIVVTIAMLLYFFSDAPLGHFAALIPVLVGGILLLAVVSPYRFARLTTFVNPQKDPLGSSYQIRQVLLALGSGGWLGVGIGKSRQKYEYLPEANTDSIFAIIGEEIGFVGALVFIGAMAFVVWRGFRIAKNMNDPFGRLLALGISCWIGVQTTINLGAMVALLPLTGVPLPFISYGGSSLIIILTAVGVLLNVSRQQA